jgi:hypothetical protein
LVLCSTFHPLPLPSLNSNQGALRLQPT